MQATVRTLIWAHWQKTLLVAGLVIAFALGVIVLSTKAAVSATVPNAALAPRIISTHLSRSGLPANGGSVALTVTTKSAATCQLTLSGHPQIAVVIQRRSAECTNGRSSFTIKFGANAAPVRLPVRFRLSVRNAKSVTSFTFKVTLNKGRKPTPTPTPTPTTTPAPAPTPSPSPTPAPTPSPTPTASLSLSATSVPSTGGVVTLTYTSTNATTCTLSSNPVFWSGTNPTAVSCNGTYQATVASATIAQQWTFTFTATSAANQSASSSQSLSQLAPTAVPIQQNVLPNPTWAGYIAPSMGAPVTTVSGQWTVPTLNCADTPNGSEATWVGVGGFTYPDGQSSGVLLQTGTQESCINGQQQDLGWWEEYPSDPNEEIPFNNFPVGPGDTIVAQVLQTASSQWETTVHDLTTGLVGVMVTGEGWGVAPPSSMTFAEQGGTANLSYSGGTTAEWIVEDQGSALTNAETAFVNFGTLSFTNIETNISWSFGTSYDVVMVQDGVALAAPSVPIGDGFTINYGGP